MSNDCGVGIQAFIDIQKVIDDVDLHVLEENLANISLCDIAQEMIGYDVNRCFINLFKLAQLIIQYLLFMQRILTNKIKELRVKLCEARLNNGSSNVYTNDTRQTRGEHSNQQNIDQCMPVHSGESQERAQRRHTNEHESMRSETRRNNGSQSQLPTDAGLRTEKYSPQKNYGSQQPQQLSKEEFGNQENVPQDVSDQKKLQEEIVGRVRRTKKNISVIAMKLNDFMVEPGNSENEITIVQDQDQSLEAHNRRSPDVVLQNTTGNMR